MTRGIDEFELIRRRFAPLARDEPGALGLRDDAAWLRPRPGRDLVVSADAIVEGVHFPSAVDPGDVARRALRVNLSDLAAKGARPRAYTLSLVLPERITPDWLEAFAAGLADDQRRYAVSMLGGDTSGTSGPLVLSVNMFGEVPENKMISRSGAGPGDDIYVSGTIGDASLGLASLSGRLETARAGDRDFLEVRFLRPEPRPELGAALVGLAGAAADVSDGLVADLGHICAASGVDAEIGLEAVPLSDAARRTVADSRPLRAGLLAAGDDYEIVFAAPASARDSIASAAAASGVPVTRIGRATGRASGNPEVVVRDDAGNRVDTGAGGYRHFG